MSGEGSGIPGAGLPPAVLAWIESSVGGSVVGLERNPSRREGWVVTIDGVSGSRVERFLRLDRETEPGSTIHEARVVEAMARHGVRVPELFAHDEGLRTALYARVPGRADLNNADPIEQRAVFEDFVDILAAWHSIDPDELDLDRFLARPGTPAEAALAEVRDLRALHHTDELGEPLVTFAIEWLVRHAPTAMDRVSLLQGDTGPANFLFRDGRVTAVIDWEWAHFGDPMEDLGNVAYRNMFHPSGDLRELFARYAERSGFPLAHDRIHYYRAQQAARSAIALARVTATNDPNTPVALNLAYKLINDRITCEAIAEAMGVDLSPPPPVCAGGTDAIGRTLGEVAVENLRGEILPLLAGEWPRYRLGDVCVLVECLDRQARLGATFAAQELLELNRFLAAGYESLEEGLRALDRQVPRLMDADEVGVLRYLADRAYRAEELFAPAVALFPGRRLTPFC